MDNNKLKKEQIKEGKKTLTIGMAIIVLLIIVTGGTFAYFAFNVSDNTISGEAGTVNLSLSVTKVLPSTGDSIVDDLLVANFNELASALNNSCLYSDGEYALCQLYKITLTNNSDGVNTRVSGSVSFNNATVPNLSWITIDNYSSSTTYNTSMLDSNINTASSAFAMFEDNYLLNVGSTKDYYLLVWVNESDDVQTDMGTFSGTVRFEDENGKGVTSTFGVS